MDGVNEKVFFRGLLLQFLLKFLPLFAVLGMSEKFQLFIHKVKSELNLAEMLLRVMGAESFSEAWTKMLQKT